MKPVLNYIIIIFSLFTIILSFDNTYNEWRQYPACRLGRLQSPIELDEMNSSYSDGFSFVYQNYKTLNPNLKLDLSNNLKYTFLTDNVQGGYINFERNGVIKQYEFIRAELYPGLHPIDEEYPDYELHLLHKKNLAFVTNKNQYRSIQDPNMYLKIVLRYKNIANCKDEIHCISDGNLLNDLIDGKMDNLNNYNIFQDKRAYFYEGSFLHMPCDENVNYYVVKDFYSYNKNNKPNFIIYGDIIKSSNRYGRPVYRNFMNYREVLKGSYIDNFVLKIIFLMFILL